MKQASFVIEQDSGIVIRKENLKQATALHFNTNIPIVSYDMYYASNKIIRTIGTSVNRNLTQEMLTCIDQCGKGDIIYFGRIYIAGKNGAVHLDTVLYFNINK